MLGLDLFVYLAHTEATVFACAYSDDASDLLYVLAGGSSIQKPRAAKPQVVLGVLGVVDKYQFVCW